jgi:hypothetical protein
MNNELKEFLRKWSWHNFGTVLAFAWRDWGNPEKISVRIANVQARFEPSISRIEGSRDC